MDNKQMKGPKHNLGPKFKKPPKHPKDELHWGKDRKGNVLHRQGK